MLRNRVRAVRKSRGISQEALAASAGIARYTLYVIEQDRGHEPQSRAMVGIAEALGVEMGDLFWTEAPEPVAVAS